MLAEQPGPGDVHHELRRRSGLVERLSNRQKGVRSMNYDYNDLLLTLRVTERGS